MLRNTVATRFTPFYPFGNTPAICLTQNLPPEQHANLLLLGCGDVRNVLFTIYASLGDRQLDFTCCDIEPAIIARNLLLLSLIVDDVKDDNATLLWNIYYHARIDSASITLLDSQVAKLLDCSESVSTWNNGPYGQTLKVCDSHTLMRVKKVWREYTATVLSQEQVHTKKKKLEDTLKRAKATRDVFTSKNFAQVTGIRSAAPTSMLAVEDLSALTRDYWDKGCLHTGQMLSAATEPNPAVLFYGSRDLILQPESNPLLGFHLATAYIPFRTLEHSLRTVSDTKTRVVEAAQAELKAWSVAFRKALRHQKVVTRWFSGDALAFAHTLQHLNKSQETYAGWHTDGWTFTPLHLDGGDYGNASGSVPTSFNTIDTSNLGDHLGTLNVLIATVPLMCVDVSSTVYTEILLQRESSIMSTLNNILCGDLDSMSFLLGLIVVERWTNATTFTETDQIMSDIYSEISNVGDQSSKGRQVRTHISWKLICATPSSGINVQSTKLAKVLYAIYSEMFEHESPIGLMSALNLSDVNKLSNPLYNRASFVALLHIVKSHIRTDWPAVFEEVLMIIENDDSVHISRNYLHELNGYLHMTGLHTVAVLQQNPAQVFRKKLSGRLANWATLPTLVAVTVQVPKTRLDFFTRVQVDKAGSIPLCCSLRPSPTASRQWLIQFGVIQSGFGHVKIDKANVAEQVHITVDEDENGWAGTSPLLVSFYVPTWILLQDEVSTQITVGFQPTPHNTLLYLNQLGPRLHFFETQIRDRCVHISRTMPHQQRHLAIAPSISTRAVNDLSSVQIAQSTLRIDFEDSTSLIRGFACRIELQGKAKERLADKSANVQIIQISPTELEILIGGSISCRQIFPRPVSATRSKVRLARRSSYIEIVAPFLSPLESDKIDTFVLPMSISASAFGSQRYPVGLNTHTINLDTCPIIDDSQPGKLDWITFHTKTIFSDREWKQREGTLSPMSVRDVRVDFKDGLFSMFMHSTGVQGHKSRIFGLYTDVSEIDTVIFVSETKLDLNDRAVVLDAAVIPLQHSFMTNPLVGFVLSRIQSISPPIIIKVDKLELKVWKSILPALAERCRTWKHDQKKCEYIKHGVIPIASGIDPASTPLCACGLGRLPKNFMRSTNLNIPKLDQMLQKYATRIAISPIFYVTHMESAFDLNTFGRSVPQSQSTNPGSAGSVARVGGDEGCVFCGKKEETKPTNDGDKVPTLLKCARCKAVKYCSKDCQKKHWKDHKTVCS